MCASIVYSDGPRRKGDSASIDFVDILGVENCHRRGKLGPLAFTNVFFPLIVCLSTSLKTVPPPQPCYLTPLLLCCAGNLEGRLALR